MKISFLTFLVSFIFVGAAQAQTLKDVNVTATQKIQMKLKNLETAVPGIKYQIHQDSLDLKQYEEKYSPLALGDYLRLRVVLLNVDRSRCLQLKKHFAGENSLVACEALAKTSKEMDLKLFLEPVIQATEGKTYLNQAVNLSPGFKFKDGFAVESPKNAEERDSLGNALSRSYVEETNCWGTAWEVARRSKEEFSIQVGDFELPKFIQDKKNVTEVIPKTKDLNQFAQQLNRIQYGDMLIVSQKNSGAILHVATFIDQQVLFEKEGNAIQFPFRLTPLEQITKLYGKRNGFFKVIRPKAKFPSAESVVKNWTSTFGPDDEDFEGLSTVTHHQAVHFKLAAQESGYVVSDRNGAYSENTVTALESAQNEGEILAILQGDEFVTKRLTQDEISALAREISNPKYPDLSKKVLLLRGLYYR
jgi:hypothetical protein